MHLLALVARALFGVIGVVAVLELIHWLKHGPSKGIPSPPVRGIPIIGHGLQILKAGPDAYNLIESWTVKYGGPNRTMAIRVPMTDNGYMYYTTNMNIIREILTKRPQVFGRNKFFEQESALKGSVFSVNEPNEWGRVRRLVSPAFNHASVDRMLPALAKVTTTLIRKWESAIAKNGRAAEVDALGDFHAFTFDVISLVGFDHYMNTLENPDNQLMQDLTLMINSVTESFFRILPWDPNAKKIKEAHARFLSLVKEVREKSINGTETSTHTEDHPDIPDYNTLLARMVTALDGESDRSRMSVEELTANMLTFYLAGTETTSSAAAWLVHYLATHPEAQSRAHAEVSQAFPGELLEECGRLASTAQVTDRLPYCQAIVWETLRLSAPIPFLGAVARRRVKINGLEFSEGSTISGMTRLIVTDEQYFPRGQEFIPERWLDGYEDPVTAKPMIPEDPELLRMLKNIAFGLGPRMCAGKQLAMDEVTILGAAIVDNFEVSPALGIEPPREVAAGTLKPSHMTIRVVSRKGGEGIRPA